jgi:hypothetical protein
MTAKKNKATSKEVTLSKRTKPAATTQENEEKTTSADRLLRADKKLAMTNGGIGNGKGGFYAGVLGEAETLDFETAAKTEGLDEEITLLRVKIKTLLEDDPGNLKLLIAAADILTKLVKTRYSMNKKQEKNLGEAIKNIIKDIGVPLGVAVMNKKL